MTQRDQRDFPYRPAQYRGFMDDFSDGNTNREPVILDDGTNALFAWTDKDADTWRKGFFMRG